ncbi:MAG: glycoside hydrolase family 9 protein, partial [Bacteroidaceae bacterium]|nr:glycoside hydrolase family 9 protein [Bacteroidaceae bacterium]
MERLQAVLVFVFVFVFAHQADTTLRSNIEAVLLSVADFYVEGSSKMAYKFIRHPYAPITWGTGAYENYAVPVAFAWWLTGKQDYRDWLIRTCDNTLGANPMGLSWITGLGQRTIRCPLHSSRYRPGGMPVAGLQAQGPNRNGDGYSWRETVFPAH